MVSFHNVRLPEDIEQGAEGGPEFKTTVLQLSSGFEKRNVEWQIVKPSYDIAYGIRTKEDLQDVMDFFYARQAKAYGFRFKDWSDFEIGPIQAIGIGDGSNALFQIIKRYTSGSYTYDRKITRVVTGTLAVYVDGVLKTVTTHYTVDMDTGLITFTGGNTPANTKVVAVTCEFDVPVRFDIDKLNVRMQWEDAMEIPSIPLVGIKE